MHGSPTNPSIFEGLDKIHLLATADKGRSQLVE